MSFEHRRTDKGSRTARIIFIAAILAVVGALALTLVNGQEIKAISGIGDSVSIKVGESLKPEYKAEPSIFRSPKLEFESGDDYVFTVSEEGMITGMNTGEALLVISAGTFRKEVSVEVKPIVEDILGVNEVITIRVGNMYQLHPIIKPDEQSDTDIKYAVSDTKIATVDGKGKIRAVKRGKCMLLVQAGGYSETYTVKVIK